MKRETFTTGLVAVAMVLFIGSVFWNKTDKDSKTISTFSGTKATVVASRTCGCCTLYAKYLEDQGFDVTLDQRSQEEVDLYKEQKGIPQNLRSCHTVEIGNYLVEGHIPVEAIAKLLQEKPDIKGIALPGMPSASPGMPGPKLAPFMVRMMDKNNQDSGLFLQM